MTEWLSRWQFRGGFLDEIGPASRRALTDVANFWVLYLVWAGLFFATILLMRMLVTRWGDHKVTMKAVVLSLLVHMVAGLWTTTVKLASDSLQARPKSFPIRRVVVDTPRHEARDLTRPNPVWDRLVEQRPEPRARAERPSLPKDDVPAPVKTATEIEPRSATLPEVAHQPAALEAAPDSLRANAPAPKPVDAPQAAIPEGTAEARAETSVPEPRAQRLPVTTGGPAASEPNRPAREAIASVSPTPLPLGPRPSVADAAPAPAELPRAPQADRTRARDTAPQTLGDDSPAAASAHPAPPGQASGPFQRLGTKTPVAIPGTSAAPARPSIGRPTITAPDPSSAIVTRPGGTGFSDTPAPALARSDGLKLGSTAPARVPAVYGHRAIPERQRVAVLQGATAESEQAVEAGLKWLVAHQNPEGYWDADGFTSQCPPQDRCGGEASARVRDAANVGENSPERLQSGLQSDSGITGLSVLAFLGAGSTQLEGPHADTVDRALRWLIRQQGSNGFLGGGAGHYARMYCHGMASIALAEAYAMTGDPTLREPLHRAIQFISEAQSPRDGGWRYSSAAQEGDMSIFGWQIMALKSAANGGLPVNRDVMSRATEFLKKAGRGAHGGLAGYRQQESVKASMTAEALFCRQILGQKRTNPASDEAVQYLLQNRPSRTDFDLYYWYYATLAMRQHGGPGWESWNRVLRETLVADQRKSGHAAGSWDARAPWGDFGGRVYSTAMATLCLEVYYRFVQEGPVAPVP